MNVMNCQLLNWKLHSKENDAYFLPSRDWRWGAIWVAFALTATATFGLKSKESLNVPADAAGVGRCGGGDGGGTSPPAASFEDNFSIPQSTHFKASRIMEHLSS
ncbi:hypothetical protein VitviT2T_018258 [Vitis vinifera]|uniref:Uncharacterized protein n=1 Tax=Vitis vinifera TaxID=29760 RepID=A0ABY9CWU8_VITVI|nr:hypothetical protein VitviT2T_018258 [Vitis vinifera]